MSARRKQCWRCHKHTVKPLQQIDYCSACGWGEDTGGSQVQLEASRQEWLANNNGQLYEPGYREIEL